MLPYTQWEHEVMPEERKLGPGVKYLNLDKSAKLVTVAGVLFKEGQDVNLEEKLGKERAQQVLKQLAKNRFFQVQGGPDQKEYAQEQLRQATSEESTAHLAIAEEARIRARDGDEAADKYVESLDENGQVKRDQQKAPIDKPGQGQDQGQGHDKKAQPR
jgi:aconitase B